MAAALKGALVLAAALACTSGGDPDPSPTASAPRAIGGSLAYVTRDEIALALPDGSVRTLARHAGDATACAWSGDGRYAGWVQGDGSGGRALYVHEIGTGRTATWADQRVTNERLAGTATGFASLHRGAGENLTLVVAHPARMLAGGKPAAVRLSLPKGTLLSARGFRVYVDRADPGAAFTGGPSTVYAVTLDGRATRLFANPRDWPVHHAALSADGRRIVHSAGDRLSQDRVREWVVVRDLASGRELDVPTPSLPGASFADPLSIEVGADGQVVTSVEYRGAQGEEMGARAYVLDGDAWREVASDATWAATGPTGTLAVVSRDQRLSAGGRHLAGGVECAAWAP